MTFDTVALAPLSAPTQISKHTVVVGSKSAASIFDIQTGFAHTLNQPGANPALVVTTSGSTGKPKQTVLSSAALYASARATEECVGVQQGQWMLALPTHYVAGAQVLARSIIAGTAPVITDSVANGSSFSAQDFLRTAERMTAPHRMVSLVPTQLHTLLEAADANGQLSTEILDALGSFKGILLGGAPASAALMQRARAENLALYCTYGSAETSGGCVYEGKALAGVRIEIEAPDEGGVGRIWLGGDTLASGYLNDSERTGRSFYSDSVGRRWYRTDDLGRLNSEVLEVLGRSDDVLISGGVKLSPRLIAQALEEHSQVREAAVFGVADQRWGQAVCALVSVLPGARRQNLEHELKELVKTTVSTAAAPKVLVVLDHFPLLTTGKPDRSALQELVRQAYARQNGEG